MIRSAIAGFLFLFATVSSSWAQAPCAVPNTLINGNNADATLVNANFAAVLGCINSLTQTAPRGALGGLTLSTAGGSLNFAVAVGTATSDDATTSMNLAISTAKSTAPWAVGSGSGSLDAGSILPTHWYHVFLIERTDTGVVDVLVSLNPTTPTLPASYTKKRRIGSMKTDGSSAWTSFVQSGDTFLWATQVLDVPGTSYGTSNTPVLLNNVPTGLTVEAWLCGAVTGTSANASALVSSPLVSQTDGSTAAYHSMFANAAGQFGFFDGRVLTNASGQINISTSAASGNTVYLNTRGWIDRRGRDN